MKINFIIWQVGAVALDVFGNLAAATSTGGMTNKIEGRVGKYNNQKFYNFLFLKNKNRRFSYYRGRNLCK